MIIAECEVVKVCIKVMLSEKGHCVVQ